MCVCFFSRRRLSSETEVESGGFIQLCLGIEDHCFDLPIHNQGHFIGANYQAIGDVMAVGLLASRTQPNRNRHCRKFSEFYSACPDFSGPALLITRLFGKACHSHARRSSSRTIFPTSMTRAHCMRTELRLLHGGSSDCRDIAVSSGGGAIAVHDLAIIIDLNPAPTAADMRIYVGAHKNHMCVFFGRCGLPCQLEVELSGLARLRLSVGNGCFDLSTDNESGLVSGNSQAIADIAAVGICLDDLGKIFRFNPDVRAFDRTAAGIFHNPFKSRRASADGERY